MLELQSQPPQSMQTFSMSNSRPRIHRKDSPPFIIREHLDEKTNEKNTKLNIRRFMRKRFLFPVSLVFLLNCILPIQATISPGFPDRLVWTPSSPTENVTYQVLRGPSSNSFTVTNAVGPATNYTILNVDFGLWWFAVRAVSTNGVFSNPTPSIQWTNLPDPPVGLGIESTSQGTADIWLPFPYSSGIVESAPDPAGLWSPFFQMKNLSAEPARSVGLRISTTDPRKSFRVQPPLIPLSVRNPPSP
jgi:hypothetical protein